MPKVECVERAEMPISNTESICDIFNHWNSKKIIVHKELTSDIVRAIKSRLSKTSKQDILTAIDRYTEILESNYYFSYKWQLINFVAILGGHLDSFLDDGKHWVNYNIQISSVPEIKPMAEYFAPKNIVRKGENVYQECLQYLKSMDYEEYLLTEHWLHFKSEFLKWSNSKCQVCGKGETMLHVHHKTYENRGRETFNDVVILCEKCHSLFHGK